MRQGITIYGGPSARLDSTGNGELWLVRTLVGYDKVGQVLAGITIWGLV